MAKSTDRRQRRLAEVGRALQGEPGIARQILLRIYWDLCRHKDDDRVDIEPVPLYLVGVEYLRRAIPQILDGVPADVALGLKSGDPGHPIASEDSAEWRRFLIRVGVSELMKAGTFTKKTPAFKYLAEHRQYPDLHDYSKNISLSWTTIRDIYYGRKL